MNENSVSESTEQKGWWDRIRSPQSLRHRTKPLAGQPPAKGEIVSEGRLVRLRKHVPANRATFQEWYADHDIARLLRHDLKPLTYVQSLVYFDSVILPGSTRGLTLAIHEATTDELIGTTGLTDIEPRDGKSCYFRILIGESRFWNRGFGTEATRLMMHEAFTRHGLNSVNLEVFDYNQRAQIAYERVGFIRVGHHIEWPNSDGDELNVVEMRLSRDAFELREQSNPGLFG